MATLITHHAPLTQVGEHPELSRPAHVDLTSLVTLGGGEGRSTDDEEGCWGCSGGSGGRGHRIRAVRELSLSGAQYKRDMRRRWAGLDACV